LYNIIEINLENIFKTYAELNKKHQFESVNITGLTNEIIKKQIY
jgi:hypothetical protein